MRNSFNLLTDGQLLAITKEKTQAERNLTLEIIELLQEIRERRLHLKRGYSSLHEYCVKELKYSDGAAFRRIKAMRLAEQVPDAIKAIESGSLSLSTASQLQSAFEAKAKENKALSANEKLDLLAQVENQSKRQVEQTIAKICPEAVRVEERIRPLSETQVKLELVIDGELLKKLERLQKLTSHKNKNMRELLEDLVNQELKRKNPEQRRETRASPERVRKVLM